MFAHRSYLCWKNIAWKKGSLSRCVSLCSHSHYMMWFFLVLVSLKVLSMLSNVSYAWLWLGSTWPFFIFAYYKIYTRTPNPPYFSQCSQFFSHFVSFSISISYWWCCCCCLLSFWIERFFIITIADNISPWFIFLYIVSCCLFFVFRSRVCVPFWDDKWKM